MKKRKEKTSKYKIGAIDKSGNIVKIFDTVYDVKNVGIYYEIIQQCLLNNIPEYKGFKWRYIRSDGTILGG